MKERLHASDYRFVLTCLVLFAAATWYSTHNFYRAFPEASIDFRVNRDGGRSLAERFLAAQNYRPGRLPRRPRVSISTTTPRPSSSAKPASSRPTA